MQDFDAGPSAFDSALHVFYALSRRDLLDLAQALVALRVANQGSVTLGPLAPSPIMAAQGLSGPMASGVRALILRFAGAQNLTRVAELSAVPNELEAIWAMSAVNVIDANAATVTPFVIPTLPGEDAGTPPLETDEAGAPIVSKTWTGRERTVPASTA